MCEPVDAARVRRLLDALGRAADREIRAYLVGGTTAVLYGWRATTVDVDLALRPSDDAVLRAIPRLKESLRMNIELASPAEFIPLPPGWEERSPFVARVGRVAYHHFDLYAQALAKVERGHRRDLDLAPNGRPRVRPNAVARRSRRGTRSVPARARAPGSPCRSP